MSYLPICTHEWTFWNGLKRNSKVAFMKIFAFLSEAFHLFEQQFSGCAAVVSLAPIITQVLLNHMPTPISKWMRK